MSKIVVTGGAGFIGSHLCEELLKRGNEVICLDNLITGNIDNIKKLESNPSFRFIEMDVCEALPLDFETDEVYHLASPASPNSKSPKSYHSLPFETMRVNSKGTWNLCDFALKKGAKFLYASTSEVYGDPLEHPQNETYNGNVSTTGPRSVYDEAKRFGETITSAFVRAKDLDGKIVRIFNTYGSKMALDDGRVVMVFAKSALKNEPLPIFGEGEQTRAFCFISDMVEGLIAAMEKGENGEVYNLGNPEELKITELAEKIIKLTGSLSKMEMVDDLPEDDPQKRRPDIEKAKKYLNWEPKVSLDEGLPIFLDYVAKEIKKSQ